AVSLAARRLAREANDPDPDFLGRVGLFAGLGLWAAAAVEPEWLAGWLAEDEPDRREALELRDLGVPLGALGRNLAERWGCDRLAADASWLLDEPSRGLRSLAGDPGRIAVLQDAYRLAESTPWSLTGAGGRMRAAHDPRIKLLIAEVQSRCAAAFLDGE